MSKTYVVGDIHGGYKALLQVLERSNFDYQNDTLIQLGDVCDGGGGEVFECVEELLKITNGIFIRGNHDEWFNTFLLTGIHPNISEFGKWEQGGESTKISYENNCDMNIPDSHRDFFRKQIDYFVDDKNNLYVHGGFNRHIEIEKQSPDYIYYWDRDLWMAVLSFKAMKHTNHPYTKKPYEFKMKSKFNKIFIGHTSTENWDVIDEPMKAANIINIDQGCGYEGKLTMYCVDDDNFVNEMLPNNF